MDLKQRYVCFTWLSALFHSLMSVSSKFVDSENEEIIHSQAWRGWVKTV